MAQTTKVFGESVLRKEDDRFLTGRGNFVADMLPPGTVFAKFVRSPYAHARIRSINTAKARRLPGVLDVLTAEDLKDQVGDIITAWAIPNANLKTPAYPPLAREVVRYAGEAVAVVVAENTFTAEDGRDLVEVEYDPLPVVTDVEAATKKAGASLHGDAPDNVAFKWTLAGGDIDKVFNEAEVVVSQRFVNQRLQPTALEPRAAIAQFEPGTRELTLHVTSQNPFVHRLVLSIVLKHPEHLIHVIAPDVGGGFGSKIPVYPWEAIVCHLAMRLGRPVKWVEDRMENYVATIHGRDHVQYVDLAAKKDGTILGIRARVLANMGAYLSTAAPGIPTILFGFMVGGCYAIQAGRVEVTGVFTNTTPVDAYRGAGRPEALFLLERIVDILARKLKKDPADIRRKNFIPADKFPYATAMGLTYDSGNYAGTLEKALDKVGYEKLRKEQAEGRRKGKLIGIGLSTYVEICGLGPSAVVTSTGFAGGLWGASTVRLHPTGKATVYTGGHPHGQGEETTFAQIVGDELGLPVADIEVVHGDTKLTPYGQGTYGSRTTPVEGGSIALSARKVKDKARKIAAHLLEAREEDLEFADGKFVVKGSPKAAKTIQEIAWAAYMAGNLPKGVEPVLDATTFYDPTNFVFPFGCHICVVDVDRETGQVKIRRYVAVDDVGNQINPMIVEGQVHGGVLQGLAQAMLEQSVYDENGNLLTNSLIEYLVPTALEAPRIETDSTVTPSPHNPLGVKGVGETGTIASSQAYVNAVCDALGVDHIDMPITPEKVWRVLQKK
ncbi:MAG: xanthine dehydrogenase family protein molybdopterin-binding subunit [Methanobacteriota archaeon]|nr:MAG: xanthine dehydrogenase family protein molybdopterin-binding subunit [Euryarchaeota archaeon]